MAGQPRRTERPPDAGAEEEDWEVILELPEDRVSAPPPPVVHQYQYPPQGYYYQYPPPYPGPYPVYYPYPLPPPRPPPDPYRWLNPLWVLLVLILVLVITVTISIPIAIVLLLSYSTPQQMISALTTPLMLLVLLVIQDSIMVIVPYAFYIKTRLLTWVELGLTSMSAKDAMNRTGVGLVAGLGLSAIILAVTKYINYQTSGGVPMSNLDTVPNYVFMLLGGAVVAPIAEELFFRGVALKGVMKWLERRGDRNPFLWAMLFSSFLFAIVHGYDVFGTVVVFMAGIIFAVLFYKSNSLVTPMIAHAAYNGVLITAEFLKLT